MQNTGKPTSCYATGPYWHNVQQQHRTFVSLSQSFSDFGSDWHGCKTGKSKTLHGLDSKACDVHDSMLTQPELIITLNWSETLMSFILAAQTKPTGYFHMFSDKVKLLRLHVLVVLLSTLRPVANLPLHELGYRPENNSAWGMKAGADRAGSTKIASAAHETFGVSWALLIKELCSLEHRMTCVFELLWKPWQQITQQSLKSIEAEQKLQLVYLHISINAFQHEGRIRLFITVTGSRCFASK